MVTEFCSFGVAWVLPKKVIDLLVGWRNWLGKCSLNIWNLVPHCVMWVIWREHNSHIFEDMELTGESTLSFICRTLFDWCHAWGFTSRESIPLFLDFLSSCTYIYIGFFSVVCTYFFWLLHFSNEVVFS